ncbi:MAG: hypothetical protein ACYC27_04855 [Armatimonadota bacterium]
MYKRKPIIEVIFALIFARILLSCAQADSAKNLSIQPDNYWWKWFPSFASDDKTDTVLKIGARSDLLSPASDPTWGPYAQRLTELDQTKNQKILQGKGVRITSYVEGFGDILIYAAGFEKKDGSFLRRKDDPSLTLIQRNHWCWASDKVLPGNTIRWVGIHSSVNNEDFVYPSYTREKREIPIPLYPDGRKALGWIPGKRYPLNARIYDAGGAKDINGNLSTVFDMPASVNEIDPKTGKLKGPIDGLFPAIIGKDDISAASSYKQGDTVYCGLISVNKDLSNPFWIEYARLSIREILKQGVDGIWCDNYSPWDNFGYPPVRKAFGDWSVARFRDYLNTRFTPSKLRAMGINHASTFDIRTYLKQRAEHFGAKDTSSLSDIAWSDIRWLDDPVWCAFKSYRQEMAQKNLKAFYNAIHDEARKVGRPDFCVAGNDIPFYGLGWTRDAWLDMVSTEVTPGWHMGAGSRGIMIPPVGKMAVVYRVALEHQKGPFCNIWYYLNNGYETKLKSHAMARTLMAEGFANGAFLLYLPSNPLAVGTADDHAWWNKFIRGKENWFGRRKPAVDVGILFSGDNQLYQIAPGGYPDLDNQPHIFEHYGWATAMIDAHIPYRVITDWKIDAAHLNGLKTFIIPDAECLPDSIHPSLDRWVRSGGKLIITGQSGNRFGPENTFRKRNKTLLSGFIGMNDYKGDGTKRLYGKGSVVWTPKSLGADYYLKSSERASLLPGLVAAADPYSRIDAIKLPTTVSISIWESTDGNMIYTDMVNYNVSQDSDNMIRAEDLVFRIRVPEGWNAVTTSTVSPDRVKSADVSIENGWATIRLPKLVQYASVRITRKK